MQLFHRSSPSHSSFTIFLPYSSPRVLVWASKLSNSSCKSSQTSRRNVFHSLTSFLLPLVSIHFSRISKAIRNWKKAGFAQMLLHKNSRWSFLTFPLNLFCVICSSGHVWSLWHWCFLTMNHAGTCFWDQELCKCSWSYSLLTEVENIKKQKPKKTPKPKQNKKTPHKTKNQTHQNLK